MDPAPNPFAALSLIVAPAILTNACSVLSMSTSNRLARAVDRARDLSRQLEDPQQAAAPEAPRRFHELMTTETRALMLVRVLRSFYVALGGFALATLVSLVGAVLAAAWPGTLVNVFEALAAGAGVIAVAALVHGTTMLIRETRLAVNVMQARAERVRDRLERRLQETRG